MSAEYDERRTELLQRHAEARRRRDAADLGSEAHRAAVAEIGRLEIELAKLAREQDPPLV